MNDDFISNFSIRKVAKIFWVFHDCLYVVLKPTETGFDKNCSKMRGIKDENMLVYFHTEYF